ncbi:FtsX-like permease family protein [Actinosynnema sp. ALI-1.44]|uniref:FtsX-like permease family protein n=1 Tax=Actinosynnema sp. ALI-1.44 TaxID=1933779 RepID=UPI00143CE2F8|nr:FtsX-like permease family protein [Actinosynnema sp. ALI-1.44]
MTAAALVCCALMIGAFILMIVAHAAAYWLLPMFAVTEFVVYKAFAVTVRRRRRDVALLRCFGASRSQVFNGVLTEAAWVGMAGAAVGLLSVFVFLDRLTFDLGVFAALVGGSGAVLAALVPAVRASRIPPSGPPVGMV